MNTSESTRWRSRSPRAPSATRGGARAWRTPDRRRSPSSTRCASAFDGADAALLTEYRGLNVAAHGRNCAAPLREAGGEYKIYKNTLVRFAARDLGLEIDELLTGPTAIAFVDGDAVERGQGAPRLRPDQPGPRRQGRPARRRGLLDRRRARALADVAPREVLLARLAGAMAAPMQQFAGLLQALPRNFAYGLKALIDEKAARPRPSPSRHDRGRPDRRRRAETPPRPEPPKPTADPRRRAADDRRPPDDRDRRRRIRLRRAEPWPP